MTSSVRTVVFPIAGLGTRFLPATKAIPKEMLPVVDRPLIEYAVNEAKSAGINRFIFVVPSLSKDTLVIKHFSTNSSLEETLRKNNKLAELKLIQENSLDSGSLFNVLQEQPLGLGHAVLCAKEYIDDSHFAVILPDDLVLSETHCMKQMADAHAEVGGNILAIEEVESEFVNRYGILKPGRVFGSLIQVEGIIEKPEPENAPSNLAAIGRYILSRRVFDILEDQETGFGGEIQLTDAINAIASQEPVHGVKFTGKRYDCGNKAGYVAANIAYASLDEELKAKVENLGDYTFNTTKNS